MMQRLSWVFWCLGVQKNQPRKLRRGVGESGTRVGRKPLRASEQRLPEWMAGHSVKCCPWVKSSEDQLLDMAMCRLLVALIGKLLWDRDKNMLSKCLSKAPQTMEGQQTNLTPKQQPPGPVGISQSWPRALLLSRCSCSPRTIGISVRGSLLEKQLHQKPESWNSCIRMYISNQTSHQLLHRAVLEALFQDLRHHLPWPVTPFCMSPLTS